MDRKLNQVKLNT